MNKLLLFALALGTAAVGRAQTIGVSIATITNQNVGTQFNVAVQTGTNILASSNVKAYQFSIALPTNCTFVSIVHQSGDLGFAWGTPTYLVSNNTLSIASAGSTNITGSGTFFRIRLQAANPGTAPIDFSPAGQCFFNQGSPNRLLTNGSVQVNPLPVITVDPPSALLVPGETVACSASGGTAPYTYSSTAPTVGSMSANTFTALTQGLARVQATDAAAYSGTTTGWYDVRTYDLAIGSDQGSALHAFSVPITLGNPGNVPFTSGDLHLSFNNSAFDLTGVTTTGFALAGTNIITNVVGNELYFSFAGTVPLNPATGTTLCLLNFVKDPAWTGGATSPIDAVSVLFDQTHNARTTSGMLTLNAPVNISIDPPTNSLIAGAQQAFTVLGGGTPPFTWSVSNPAVASISSGGLLTALNGGTVQVSVTDADGNAALSGPITVHDADLSLASVSVLAGTMVHVPVVLGPSVNNEPVLSFQFTVGYDANALSFVGVEQTATLSQGWSTSYATPPGQLVLSAAGTNAVTPGGVLLFLKFQTLAPLTPGSSTDLSFASSLINEGDPVVASTDGVVTATNNSCTPTGCMNPYACNYNADALCDDGSCIFDPALCAVRVSVKAILEGPYVSGTGLMNDNLRTLGTFPLTEPYTAAGYVHTGGGGGETTTAGVLAVTGNNAIVDWVVVELRSDVTPSTVLATRSALLQRDGDVVATDGVNPVSLAVSAGNYHVAIRHRNHLGVMRATALPLSATTTEVDLTSAGTTTYGTNARKTVGMAQVLWAGNTRRDNVLKYTGSNNDRDPILVRIGGTSPTATASGYYPEDVTLNGQVKYTGTGNDRDPILVNIGGTVPTATRLEQLP